MHKKMFKNSKICRTCSESNNRLHAFHENTDLNINISEMLASFLPQLFIEPDLPMPQQLCDACLENLKICFKFRRQCLNVHEILRKRMAHVTYEENEPFMEIEVENLKDIEAQKEIIESENEDPLDVVNNSDSDVEESKERTANSQYEDEAGANENVVSNTLWNEQIQSDTNLYDSHAEYTTNDLNLSGQSNKKKGYKREAIKTYNSKSQTNTLVPKLFCRECNKGFRRKYLLKQHENVHLLSHRHVCDLCNYRFGSLPQLVAHKREHKQRGSFKCDKCERVFEKKAFLASHCRLQHNNITEFNCKICELTFKTSLCYSKHKVDKHPGENVEDDVESDVNKSTMGEVNNNRCDICDKSFNRAMGLREHMNTHTGEKPFKCPECYKTFRGRSALRQHMLRHQEKTIECTECPMKFYQVSELRKHMITHSTTKLFECELCGSRFTRADSLSHHKKIHEGHKPFKCEECLKTFIRKKSLEIHMITHSGARPYKCKYCEHDYTAHGDLNKHLRSHLGENIYACDECSETFRYNAELRHHKSKHFKENKYKNQEPSNNEVASNTVDSFAEEMFSQ